jgi:hypothetical protein
MKFSDAFNAAFEKEKERSARQGKSFVVTPATAKTLTFLWNMLALAQNKLDNLAFIDDNNNILEAPLEDGDTKLKIKGGRKGSPKNNNTGQTSTSENADKKTADKNKGNDGIVDDSKDSTQ